MHYTGSPNQKECPKCETNLLIRG